jgi:hypothetical protein
LTCISKGTRLIDIEQMHICLSAPK